MASTGDRRDARAPASSAASACRLFFNPETDAIERAAAIEDVDLRVGPGAPMPGTPAAEGGDKRLRCRRLQVFFRAKGVLDEALAVNPASLEVLPGPGDAQERRRVESHRLHFGFDEQGRLTSLEAHGDPRRRAGRSSPTTSLGSRPAPGRRVESDTLVSSLDPVSGAIRDATFDGRVVFTEPGRKAWAGQAVFDEAAARVVLSEDPRIVDEAEGSELRARRIRLGTRRGGWRRARTFATPGPPGEGQPGRCWAAEEPTVVLCREFDYDAQTRTARYRENALMRSGKDEIRAPLIALERAGRRRRGASPRAAARLRPPPARRSRGRRKDPAPVETRSREMVYEETANRIVYTGDVEIRQGDILTRSPEAIVTAHEGRRDRRPPAGGRAGRGAPGRAPCDRRAGTYTPANETLVLVGEKVVLLDVDRRLEGRILDLRGGQ